MPDSDPLRPHFAPGPTSGIAGELHPRVRNAFGLGNERVVLAELNVAPLVRPSWQISQMAPISVYPPVVEDLAFVVPEEVTQRRLLDAIVDGGGRDKDPMLTAVELFDIYAVSLCKSAINHWLIALHTRAWPTI